MNYSEEILNSVSLNGENLTVAERFYKNHLKNVARYQKNHPEKCAEKCKRYNQRLKEEHPEKYQEMLEQKRHYYLTVTKPKLLLNKQMKEKLKEDLKIEIITKDKIE
jgi:hypothetical protein